MRCTKSAPAPNTKPATPLKNNTSAMNTCLRSATNTPWGVNVLMIHHIFWGTNRGGG
jgi:hypothetical protein